MLNFQIDKVETDLRRLRDPLQIHLPPSYTSKIAELEDTLDQKKSPLAKLKSIIEDTSKKIKNSAT